MNRVSFEKLQIGCLALTGLVMIGHAILSKTHAQSLSIPSEKRMVNMLAEARAANLTFIVGQSLPLVGMIKAAKKAFPTSNQKTNLVLSTANQLKRLSNEEFRALCQFFKVRTTNSLDQEFNSETIRIVFELFPGYKPSPAKQVLVFDISALSNINLQLDPIPCFKGGRLENKSSYR